MRRFIDECWSRYELTPSAMPIGSARIMKEGQGVNHG